MFDKKPRYDDKHQNCAVLIFFKKSSKFPSVHRSRLGLVVQNTEYCKVYLELVSEYRV